MVMGLIRPDAGHVFFHEEEISSLPVHEKSAARHGLSCSRTFDLSFSIREDNILCILENSSLEPLWRQNRLEELLEELHLAPLAKKKAGCFLEENADVRNHSRISYTTLFSSSRRTFC